MTFSGEARILECLPSYPQLQHLLPQSLHEIQGQFYLFSDLSHICIFILCALFYDANDSLGSIIAENFYLLFESCLFTSFVMIGSTNVSEVLVVSVSVFLSE